MQNLVFGRCTIFLYIYEEHFDRWPKSKRERLQKNFPCSSCFGHVRFYFILLLDKKLTSF